MMIRRLAALVVTALVTLAGCGGGGGGGGSSVPPATPAPTATPRATASISFEIVIPGRLPSAAARLPRYVSPATATVQVIVNGGAPQTFPVSGGAPCSDLTSPPISGNCSLFTVQAPIGPDTFVINLLDGSGNVLSSGTVTQTIVQDQTNRIAVTFNGNVVGLRVGLSNPSPPAGTPAKIGVTLLPLDAAGFTVLGAPGVLPTINVSDSDASGATALYLAGSDRTCGTQGTAPAQNVTVNGTTAAGVATYPNVCLSYTGAALSGATISATVVSGGSGSGSTALTPTGAGTQSSGVWALGLAPGNVVTLERVDVTLTPSNAISGSNTGLSNVTSLGIAADAAANVYVLNGPFGSNPRQFNISRFASNASGNVAPSSVTTFSISAPPAGAQFVGPALDGNGNAYIGLGTFPTYAPVCALYRIPLTGGSSAATLADDCKSAWPDNGTAPLHALHSDALFRVSASKMIPLPPGTGPLGESVARFRTNADGTLTPVTELTVSDGTNYTDFAYDPSGNVLFGGGSRLALYSGAGFVNGQNTTYTSPLQTWNGQAPLAVDPSGNVYSGDPANNGLQAFAGGSSTATAHSSFVPFYLTSAVAAGGGGGGAAITAQPTFVETQSSTTFTVTESGYSGPFTEQDNCGSIATITPQSANGPSATFTVTSKHQGGSCVATVSDNLQRSVLVPVGITAILITGNAKRH